MHCNGQVDKIVPNGLGSIPFQNTVPGMRRKISSKVLCSISKRNTVSIFILQDIFIIGTFDSTLIYILLMIHFLAKIFCKSRFLISAKKVIDFL